MTLHSPVAIQPATGDPSLVITGQEFRRYSDALISAALTMPFNSSNFASGGGVTNSGLPNAGADTGDFAVNQRGAGANFSVDVSAGTAFVIGTDVTSQGSYSCWNDGVVNVVTPSAPGSGTRNHRLVLQVQDKLENGTFTGYQAAFVLCQDTGGGFSTAVPSPNTSYITLAQISIAAAQPSVTNANITDYRRAVGPIACEKPSATGRGSTTLSDDGDLQLWGLQGSSTYKITGNLFYHGADMTTATPHGSQPGGISFTFRTPSGSSGTYSPFRVRGDDALVGYNAQNWTDTLNGQTQGTGTSMSTTLSGTFSTGSTTPNNYLVLQWGQDNSSGTNTTLEAGSWLHAERVS